MNVPHEVVVEGAAGQSAVPRVTSTPAAFCQVVSRPLRPMIAVGELPFWMRVAPNPIPKPPVLNAGTGSCVTIAWLCANVVREIQLSDPRWIGVMFSAISYPRFTIDPPLTTCEVNPVD